MDRFDLERIPQVFRELFGRLNVLMARLIELEELEEILTGDFDPNLWPAIHATMRQISQTNKAIGKLIGCDHGGDQC